MRFTIGSVLGTWLIVACGGQIEPTNRSSLTSPQSKGNTSAAPSASGAGDAADVTLDGNYSAMTADASYLYVAGSNRVARIPKAGGAPAVLNDEPSQYQEGIAVDDSYVYVTRLVDGTVVRLPKAGGPSEVIASGQVRPWGIAVDDTNVYWACQGDEGVGVAVPTGGQIAMRAKAGGDVVVLAPNEQTPVSIAVADGWVYFIDGVWGDTNGALRSVPVDSTNGGVKTLADHRDMMGVPSLFVGGGFVAWSEEGAIFRTNADGSGPITPLGQGTVLAGWDARVYRAVMDGRRLDVYDATSNGAALGSRTFGDDQTWFVNAAVADADRVYWLDYWWSYKDAGPYSGVHSVLVR